MFEIGRVCIKTAGRDSNNYCVIVDVIDKAYVLVDGETRRKRCSISHIEPLDKVLKIEKNAPHEAVVEAMKKAGVRVRERKAVKIPKTEEKPKQPKKAQKKKSAGKNA